MTLVATPGAADANSFVTLEEFEAFITTRLRVPSSVSGAIDSQKSAALMWATQLMGTVCWTGIGSTAEQALPWPRTGMLYRTGYAVAVDAIPSDLKTATMQLAYNLLIGDPTSPASAIFKGLSKIKAGSVELGFQKLADLSTLTSVPASIIAFLPKSWLCNETQTSELIFDAI